MLGLLLLTKGPLSKVNHFVGLAEHVSPVVSAAVAEVDGIDCFVDTESPLGTVEAEADSRTAASGLSGAIRFIYEL